MQWCTELQHYPLSHRRNCFQESQQFAERFRFNFFSVVEKISVKKLAKFRKESCVPNGENISGSQGNNKAVRIGRHTEEHAEESQQTSKVRCDSRFPKY
jgi:hypothetical protein